MTLGDIIDAVLANVGDARTGTDVARTRILSDLRQLLQFDIQAVPGGIYFEGVRDLTLGGAGAPSDGAYPIPNRVRSANEPFLLDRDVWVRDRIYRDPADFWARYDPDPITAAVGQPTAVLVYGLEFTFRPIPPVTDTWTFRFYGTEYKDFSALQESSEVPRFEFEGVLIAGGTVLHAARNEYTQVAQTWQSVFDNRLAALSGGAKNYLRKDAANTRYL